MKDNLFFAFGFIGKIGFATALPLVFFGLVGRFIDNRLGTSPKLFLAGLAIATVLVYFTIRHIVKKALKDFEKINK